MRHSLKFKYTNITLEELRIMEENKLGGFPTRLYIAIKAFCHGDKDYCFPNYRTLAEALGLKTEHFKAQINKALNKLVSIGLIIKNHYTEEKRFIIAEKTNTKQNRDRQGRIPRARQGRLPNRKQRHEEKKTLLCFNEEVELNKTNIERFLFGLIDQRKLQYWNVTEIRRIAREWFKSSSKLKIDMVLRMYSKRYPEEVIEHKLSALAFQRRTNSR